MSSKLQYWVIADIHGEFGNLMKLMRKMRKSGFCLKKNPHQRLIQLGDRCDRGTETYRVNHFFKRIEERFPNQVVCLRGNHEDMVLECAAGNKFLILSNGIMNTVTSYASVTKLYGKNNFGRSLAKTGHLKWLKNQPYFYETDDYFFCHAPIPKLHRRKGIIAQSDFRRCVETLTWSFSSMPESSWIDGDPTEEGKISVHGHIHGLQINDFTGEPWSQVRKYGNAIIADTGSGCVRGLESNLACVVLPDMKVIDTLYGQTEIFDATVSKEEE